MPCFVSPFVKFSFSDFLLSILLLTPCVILANTYEETRFYLKDSIQPQIEQYEAVKQKTLAQQDFKNSYSLSPKIFKHQR